MTYDPDAEVMAPACNVHCTFALPCKHNGEPAVSAPLHALATQPREDTLRFWLARTLGQRPLVIHCAVWPGEHDQSGDWPYPGCPCGGEVIEPTEVRL